MSPRRLSWGMLAVLAACERAPTRLERVSQQIETKIEDADLARGRAALAELKPRTIAPPPGRAGSQVVQLSLVVSRADGELDAAAAAIVEQRLESLRLAATSELRAGKLALTIAEAPAEKVPIIAAALAAQGRLRAAHLERPVPREAQRVDDPLFRWVPLPVERVEPAEPGPHPGVPLLLAPAGATALAQATGQGGHLALAFDDRVLMVVQVAEPVTGGRLTLLDSAAELGDPRGAGPVLAAALAGSSPTPFKVEIAATSEATECADPASCEAACDSQGGRACLRVAEARTEPEVQVAALSGACAMGAHEGCTRLCARAEPEPCAAAIETLRAVGSVWSDPAHAAALDVERCRKGEFAVCPTALSTLLFGPLGEGDFVTADALLRGLRDEALVVRATALREFYLDAARELCREPPSPAEGAGACLFVAQSSTGNKLAAGDPALDEALRAAGRYLREADER